MKSIFRIGFLPVFYFLLFCLVSVSTASAYSASVDKTSVELGESLTVTWSGFGDTVNVAVYKGNTFWTYANTQAPYAGSQSLDTTGWETRSDYKIRVEQKSNTTIYVYSQTFSVNPPSPPAVIDFSINGNSASTTSQTVYLQNSCTESPTHYMASESSSFSGASWNAYDGAPSFSLSSGAGTKTVYFKVKNGNGESSVSSDSISYEVPVTSPPSIFDYLINGGEATTPARTVYLQNNYTGDTATYYIASENSDFSGSTWQTYNDNPSFMLSTGYGVKTIYLKLKNSVGESAVKSDTIEYVVTPNGSIAGTITNNLTSFIVSQADIVLELNGSQVASTTSSSTGAYSFSDVLPDMYQITITKPGYSIWTGNCLVSSGIQTDHDVALTPVPMASTNGGGLLKCQ